MTAGSQNKIHRLGLLWVVLILCHMSARGVDVQKPPALPSDSANGAEKHYDQLFGEEEKQAAASNKNAAHFAARLIATLPSVSDDKDFAALLCEKAMLYGMRDVEGYPAAIAGIKKLGEIAPDRSAALNGKRVEIYRLIYTRGKPGKERNEAGAALIGAALAQADGLYNSHQYVEAMKVYREAQTVAVSIKSSQSDEIGARVKDVQAKIGYIEKIRALADRVAQQPADMKLRRLLMESELLDMDDAAEAAKVAGDSLGAECQAGLQLAMKDPKALSDIDALALARFYRDVADKATVVHKNGALGRSSEWYGVWLAAHDKKDGDRLAVSEEMAKVNHQLDSLGSPSRGDRIVLWNQHNSNQNDCGTKRLNLTLLDHGVVVWRRDDASITWEPAKDCSLVVSLPHVGFDAVKIEITEIYGRCGGLAEIQVFKGGENIALGARASASGVYDPAFVAANLTDGITTSAENRKGYWVLPEHVLGWAEITLKGSPKTTAP